MNRLVLIRHATSGWGNPTLSDHERTLTPNGHAEARASAQWLAERIVTADLMIVSTAVRAITTAEYFSRALRITDKQFVTTRSLYECDAAGITDQISWLTLPVMQTVIVVAHNPTLTILAEQLTRGKVVSMVPCAIVSIVFPAGTQWGRLHEGDLEFCADPTGILP